MPYYLLNPERRATFPRYARTATDEPKRLTFEPGRITFVADDDVKYLAPEDLHPNCLTEITDEAHIAQRGFSFASSLDVPPVAEAEQPPVADKPAEEAPKPNRKLKGSGKLKPDSAPPVTEAPAAGDEEAPD
jgi:hypothetical protein